MFHIYFAEGISMYPLEHFILGIIVSIYFFIFQNPLFAIIFLSASVLIDADHYILYLFQTNFANFSIKKSYLFFTDHTKRYLHRDKLYIFHTIEFLLILLFLQAYFKDLYTLAMIIGIVFHHILDFIGEFRRYLKLGEFCFKRPSCIMYLVELAYRNAKISN